MLLVVDANILIAALIRDAYTREMLMSEKLNLIAPEFLVEEALKYAETIASKTKLDKETVKELLQETVQKAEIKIYPKEEFGNKIDEASQISPDPNDTPYFALALKEKAAIWSNDKELKKQNKIKVINTKELREE